LHYKPFVSTLTDTEDFVMANDKILFLERGRFAGKGSFGKVFAVKYGL
jgi:hypothetical protein